MDTSRKIEISHKTVVFTILFLISLWFIYQIRDVILSLFVALLIMSILNPIISISSKYKIPKPLSVLIVYFLMFTAVGVVIAILIPPLANETSTFIRHLPDYLENIGFFGIYSEQVVGHLLSQVGMLPSQAAKVTISLLSNALSVITILIFAFYMLIYRDRLDLQLGYFLGERKKKEINRFLDLLEKKLGGWARGELSLMFLVWIFSYVGLLLLGIPFALPLSLLAGLLEVIPYVGPMIAAVPVIIIGFGISSITGIAAAALTFLVQQVENYVFVPKVMEKSVGVNPLVTLLALAIGFKLAGVVGIIISVPVVITIRVINEQYFISKNPSIFE